MPDEEDFERFLDYTVRFLYNEEAGTRLSVGRLIIEKVDDENYDVYIKVGEFK